MQGSTGTMGNRKSGAENLRVKHLMKRDGCVCIRGLELVGGNLFAAPPPQHLPSPLAALEERGRGGLCCVHRCAFRATHVVEAQHEVRGNEMSLGW